MYVLISDTPFYLRNKINNQESKYTTDINYAKKFESFKEAIKEKATQTDCEFEAGIDNKWEIVNIK